jgi:hypothetical protein
MTSDPADADLRMRFAALRRHDDTLVPAFDTTLARAAARTSPARPRLTRHHAWVASCLAAVLLGLWLMPGPRTTQDELGPDMQLAWRAPTDGLLADGVGPLRGLSWNSLPTAALGRSTFSHYQEDR